MCGIVGELALNRSVLEDVIDGLFALEHRGEDSSGVCGYNIKRQRLHLPIRGAGTASEVFKDIDTTKYNFNLAIGHARYATSGDEISEDSQPLLLSDPPMVLAHNGQVVNVVSMKKKNEKKHTYFSSCDVEHILYSLGDHMLNSKFYKAKSDREFAHEHLFPAIRKLFDEVKGAYSIIGIVAKRGMIAFKDPHGIRPLSYGIREEDEDIVHLFASESTVHNFLGGFKEIRELERGEAMFISLKGEVQRKIIHQKRPAFCCFEPVYFAWSDSDLINNKVYETRVSLGNAIAEEFKELRERIDTVMDSPKTAIPAAINVAFDWRKDYGGIVHRGTRRSFLQKNQEERRKEIRRKFSFIKTRIDKKRVVVIDDSIVRGNTSRLITEELRKLDVKEVHFISTFPPYISPCVYGIDTPNEEFLIAARHGGDTSLIAEEIGADSVHYLSLENLVKVLGVPADKLCTGCIDRNYPTGQEFLHEYISERRRDRERMTKLSPS